MLQRMLGHAAQPVDFGVLLTSANLEAHIATIQSQAVHYKNSHAQELAELELFKSQMAARTNN